MKYLEQTNPGRQMVEQRLPGTGIVSVQDDEKVLDFNSGDGCTTYCHYIVCLKMVKMLSFMDAHFITIKKYDGYEYNGKEMM